MSNAVMQRYIRQTLRAGQTTIAWQGGEPTLMGLDFFRKAMEVVRKHQKAGVEVEQTIQTNGILLSEEWCQFMRENGFLVGISLDGPRYLHNAYRKDKNGNGTFDRVIRAVRLMQKHQVKFNILCTVNALNSQHPLDTYRFFRDQMSARYVQFIPIVEPVNSSGNQNGAEVTHQTVPADAYGQFLIKIFDEWLQGDVGTMFVPFFDAILAAYLYGTSSVCTLRPTCGDALALEHNGDVYSCDHFVEPENLLGNITETPLVKLVYSEKQRAFATAKQSTLPRYCQNCRHLFTCHGECPKNRILQTPDGEPGLNWLCSGLKAFFEHTEPAMRKMAELLKSGRYADEIMTSTKKQKHIARP